MKGRRKGAALFPETLGQGNPSATKEFDKQFRYAQK